MQSAKEVTSVDYEQISDDILRLHIKLKHKQHWGHQLYYRGNTLVIKIKQQPASLAISKLKIGIDAGHGGSNTGAQGISGAVEKNLTLGVALQLKNVLEAAGARVIMTRNTERFFDNQQRILFFRDSLPDLLISIHMNSANDPINAGGTMMFYRHLGYKSLSSAVYEKMIELPVKKSGIVGSFNFMLNSPTEYPNALVETLFISNPAEEALIVDAAFQRQVAEKIAAGINEFLRNADKP
ncbi:MAG: N-acetylmuramoyl-L-alanine amidase [Ferruginibacter sp.]